MRRLLCAALLALAFGQPGCSCSRMHGEVDGLEFKRCAQADAPTERTLKTATLELVVKERVVEVTPKSALRIAAFTGPIGAPLARSDVAELASKSPSLVLMLGGLGDSAEMAASNLALLASLRAPVVFIAGGADRWPVVETAFDELEDDAAQYLVQASGARELRIGADRFAIVAGSPRGRYAIDAEACGFLDDDLDDVEDALGSAGKNERTWLLSWAAPSGWGLTRGDGDTEIGDAELAALAESIGAKGGLFAYPETQSFAPVLDPKRGGLAMVVPRLGRTGTLRAEGGRVPRAVAVLTVGASGLTLAP